jgi:hypothetical protein
MSWESGPQVGEDEQGRAIAHGFVITGDDKAGYRARILVGLTALEAQWGCVEIMWADSLADLLAQARAQMVLRSMVGHAAAAARVLGGSPAAASDPDPDP